MSMERRLRIGLGLALLALLLGNWVLVNRSMHVLVEELIVSRLQKDAEVILKAVAEKAAGENARPLHDDPRLGGVYGQPGSGHYFIVHTGDGRHIPSASLQGRSLPAPRLGEGETRVLWGLQMADGERLLGWGWRTRLNGHDLQVVLARSLDEVQEYRNRFKLWLLAFSLAGGVLLLTLQVWLLRSAFRRLDAVCRDVAQVERGNRERLDETAAPAEVQPLIASFNRLLALLEQRLQRSRNALGNMAHALKTPLSLLLQDLARLGERAPADSEGARLARDAREQAERIRHLMQRELKRARMAGQGIGAQHFDARREMPDLLKVLQRVHGHGRHDHHDRPAIAVECPGLDDIPPFGEREDMLELLGNLLDNAMKWARHRVRCRFRLEPDGRICISIEDDGPGLPEERMQLLASRGMRLDESREGSGLGLAIAQDIVRLHGGSLQFSRSADLGGLCVTACLPTEGNRG